MRWIDLSTMGQVIVCIFYILALVLEVGCCILTFISKSKKRYLIFFIGLILICSTQVFMMIEIFYKLEWGIEITKFTEMISKQNIVFTIFLLIIMLWTTIFHSTQIYRQYKKEISFNSIKEAFDTLPKAISIFNQKGIPVLVNKQMHDLVGVITGKDFQSLDDIIGILNRNVRGADIKFINAEEENFEEIHFEEIHFEHESIKQPFFENANFETDLFGGESSLIKVKDKTIWQMKFRRFMFEGERYSEITANEITPIYHLTQQLQRKNRDLRAQKEKQEKLLKDMIQSKKEEEILNLKMDVHSKFGKAILSTQLFLENKHETSPIDIWKDVIQKSESMEFEQEENNHFSLKQLIDVSQVFGCRILLDGELPKDDRMSYLIISAMREAITNAVRHAKADELKVTVCSDDSNIRVQIEDNSNLNITSIEETGGLRDLRKKIEQYGASMQVICQNGVKIMLVLPKVQKN